MVRPTKVDKGDAAMDTQSDSESNIFADTESEAEAIPFSNLGYPQGSFGKGWVQADKRVWSGHVANLATMLEER